MRKLFVLLSAALFSLLCCTVAAADVSPLAIVGPLALLGLAVALAIGLICLCVAILIKVFRKKKETKKK